jgi:hypothetical protein
VDKAAVSTVPAEKPAVPAAPAQPDPPAAKPATGG